MRIRLTRDLPVGTKHKCLKGNEYEVLPDDRVLEGRNKYAWIEAITGERVKVFEYEFEIVDQGDG